MTTLADVRRGDVFLAGFRCSAADQQAGLTLGLYGPGRDKMADAQIAPDGTVTGTLAAAPALIPVQLATGFAPVIRRRRHAERRRGDPGLPVDPDHRATAPSCGPPPPRTTSCTRPPGGRSPATSTC